MSEQQPEPGYPDVGGAGVPPEPAEVPWTPGGHPYASGGPGYIPPMAGPPASGPEMPAQPPAGFVPVAALREIMDQALDRQRAEFDKELNQLRKERDAERTSVSVAAGQEGMVTEHGGGPGLDRAPTWSYYDQQLAIRGEHPLQQHERDRVSHT